MKTPGNQGNDGTHKTNKTNEQHRSHRSHSSHEQQPQPTPGFILAHGGYEQLLSFRKARIVYDGTVRFCNRFVDLRSRTHDQMVEAARSGRQNILEGSQASGTSRETEIKLTNVARASLEELPEDYRDSLRVHNATQWDRNSATPVCLTVGRETRCFVRVVSGIF